MVSKKNKVGVWIIVSLLMLQGALAINILGEDDLESYADQAAIDANETWRPTDSILNLTGGANGTQSVIGNAGPGGYWYFTKNTTTEAYHLYMSIYVVSTAEGNAGMGLTSTVSAGGNGVPLSWGSSSCPGDATTICYFTTATNYVDITSLSNGWHNLYIAIWNVSNSTNQRRFNITIDGTYYVTQWSEGNLPLNEHNSWYFLSGTSERTRIYDDFCLSDEPGDCYQNTVFEKGVELNVTNSLPSNNTQYNSNTISLNLTIDSSNLFNISLYINDTINSSITNIQGSNNIVAEFNITFPDADYSYFFNVSSSYLTNGTRTNTSYFYIDTVNPTITWNTPADGNSTTVNRPNNLTADIDLSDNNLFSYEYNITWASNDTVITSFESTSLTGDSYTIVDSFNVTNYIGNLKAVVLVCDSHTDKSISLSDVRKEDTELIYDNVKVYPLDKTSISSYDTTNLGDRYDFQFNTKESYTSQTYIVESNDYIHILGVESEYAGHLVTGQKWVDFEIDNYDNIQVDRLADNRVMVTVNLKSATTNWNFNSIGQLNCVKEARTFTSAIENNPAGAIVNTPTADQLLLSSSVSFNFTIDDDEGDNVNYVVSFNASDGQTSTKSQTGVANGTDVTLDTGTGDFAFNFFPNGTQVNWTIRLDDGTGYVYAANGTVTINTIRSIVSPSFSQVSTDIIITGNGTYKIPLRYKVGWNYTGGGPTELGYNVSISLPTGTHNVSVERANSSTEPPAIYQNDTLVNFSSFAIGTSCTDNLYDVEFNVDALNATEFYNNCEGSSSSGNCSFSVSIANNLDYQLTNITLTVPQGSLNKWNDRLSVSISYRNTTNQSKEEAKGTLNCIEGGGGISGGLGIQSGGSTGYGNDNYTSNRTSASNSDFTFDLTEETQVVNPTVTADSTGIVFDGLKLGGSYILEVDYTYGASGSSGSAGSPGAGGGGGGGGGTIFEVIGNISVSPRSVDIPFFKIPFGTKKGEVTLEISITPETCAFENPDPELECFIDAESGLVKAVYTPTKNEVSDLKQNRLIITGQGGQAFVPVTFRLINLDYYIEISPNNINLGELFTATNSQGQTIGIKLFPIILITILVVVLSPKLRRTFSRRLRI